MWNAASFPHEGLLPLLLSLGNAILNYFIDHRGDDDDDDDYTAIVFGGKERIRRIVVS